MTTINDHDPAAEGARVVSLDAAREGRDHTTTPAAEPAPAVPDTADALEGTVVRVDQPGNDRPDWLADLANRARERRPVIPPALRSRRDALSTIQWVSVHYAHVSAYHLVRVPKYAAKLSVRAPRGLSRLAGGMVRWTWDLEGHPVRMAAVTKSLLIKGL